jgi:hypothetical protein
MQAVIILGIPNRAIEVAFRTAEATFTIEERPDQLKLLVRSNGSGGGGVIYSAAHIVNVYELEPSTLVETRRKLAEARSEGRSELEQKIHEQVHQAGRVSMEGPPGTVPMSSKVLNQ